LYLSEGDGLTFQLGNKFSTKDQDHDIHKDVNCARTFKGGWWYSWCLYSNPNGLFLHGNTSTYADGIVWAPWRGFYYSLHYIEMKIKPYK